MRLKKNKALVILDSSYWYYVTQYNAFTQFKKKHPDEFNVWIKPAEETDQNNLPNLLNCETFKRILKKSVMKKCESIDWLLKANFLNEIDTLDQIDILFAMDDYTSKSFRKTLYPAYKAQRKLVPKQFDMFKIRNYVFDVIFKELELEKKFGYHFIAVDGAEADDIIAVAFNKCSDDYMLKVLFSSDHDFIQLKGVKQLDLFGKDVKCKVGDVEVTPDEYLLSKILLGDGADNIVKVFKGIGAKKVMKYVKDKAFLKESLKQDADAAAQFLLNKKLIAFSELPEDLVKKITEKVNVVLYDNEVLNESGFGNIDWL